jgi:hypothetical protein
MSDSSDTDDTDSDIEDMVSDKISEYCQMFRTDDPDATCGLLEISSGILSEAEQIEMARALEWNTTVKKHSVGKLNQKSSKGRCKVVES